MSIEIMLTDQQKKLVKPLIDEAKKAYDKGRKGIVYAQVFEDTMTVGFLSNSKARYLQSIESNNNE